MKAQSAMEYLLTFGFAIVIILVVLAALFQLGVFGSGKNAVGNSCAGVPGFSCQGAILNQNGELSMTFGQAIGTTMYDVELACAATINSNSLPYAAGGVNPFQVITTNGLAVVQVSNAASNQANSIFMPNDNLVLVKGLQCYDQGGKPLSGAIGTQFTGTIYINYTGPAPNDQIPTWGEEQPIYQKVISITEQIA